MRQPMFRVLQRASRLAASPRWDEARPAHCPAEGVEGMLARPGRWDASRTAGTLVAFLVMALAGCAPSPSAAPAQPAPSGSAPAAASPVAPAALTHVLATPPAL